MLKLLSFFSLCIIAVIAQAQNLEMVGKDNRVSVSGSASVNQIVYGVRGIESRRDPYSYYASGSVNFSIYGWSCPVSFAVSNQQVSFQQPFNQYSLHPTYKWITAHAGYNSVSFSPYTVSGHVFLGGAVDLAPSPKLTVSALYGRFLKAVEPDSTAGKNVMPAYRRMGVGLKTRYGSASDYVEIITFRAADDVHSIRYVPENDGILPQENLVMSLAAGKSLFGHFHVRAEIAASALTRDTRAVEADHSNVLAKTGFLYTARTSSSYYKAFKTSLNYQQQGYTVGVAYERIDPAYRTLGAYYFNNDLENVTVNGSLSILRGKANVAVSAGTQRDNLDKSKISTMRRVVGSLNVAFAPSQKLNISTSYSNFQTYTNIRSQFLDINQLTPFDNLDTLNYTQISQNATLAVMYTLGSNERRRQAINCNLTFQDALDKQGDVSGAGNQFYNFNTSYSLNMIPKDITVSVSFNGTLNESSAIRSHTLGPTVALSKTFLKKKLRTTLSSAYNSSYANGKRLNTVVNLRLTGSMAIQKKQSMNISLVVVDRNSNQEGAAQAFTEFTATMGYAYSFGGR